METSLHTNLEKSPFVTFADTSFLSLGKDVGAESTIKRGNRVFRSTNEGSLVLRKNIQEAILSINTKVEVGDTADSENATEIT